MLNFFNIVYQTIQQPLPVDLVFASQAESSQLFIDRDIAKHGLHHGHTIAVYLLAPVAVHSFNHPVGMARRSLPLPDKGNLPAMPFVMICCGRVTHAADFQCTLAAVGESAFKIQFRITVAVCRFTP